MVTVVLKGGLGNQAYQYAFAERLRAEGNEVQFDRSAMDADVARAYKLDFFNVDILCGQRRGNYVNEGSILYQPEFIKKYAEDTILDGYWQCEKYFLPVEDRVRASLTLRNQPSEQTLQVAREIEACVNPCFLHVRRTDNLSVRGMAFHGIAPSSYYEQAAQYIAERGPDLTFFVFSDDIEWCKENVRLDYPTIFVDHNTTGVDCNTEYWLTKRNDGTEHEDLFLMSKCQNAIIATSTFGWWGAWLMRNPDKIVIAPKQWFVGNFDEMGRDIIPQNWIRM